VILSASRFDVQDKRPGCADNGGGLYLTDVKNIIQA